MEGKYLVKTFCCNWKDSSVIASGREGTSGAGYYKETPRAFSVVQRSGTHHYVQLGIQHPICDLERDIRK